MFYDWFLDTNRKSDIEEQQKLVIAAGFLKDYLLGKIPKLPKGSIFLANKLKKNIEQGFRGQLIKKTVIGHLDEILDPNISCSKLHWAKSVRKQGVEKLQRKYLHEKFQIEILAGKQNGLTASGENSYRLNLETGELMKGVRKIPGVHSKSMDGKNRIKNINLWYFQKVTTDDGGGTDTVEIETIDLIKAAKKCVHDRKSSNVFIILTDGPFWQRKQYKKDKKTRFEKLHDLSENQIIVATSDTLLNELKERNLI